MTPPKHKARQRGVLGTEDVRSNKLKTKNQQQSETEEVTLTLGLG